MSNKKEVDVAVFAQGKHLHTNPTKPLMGKGWKRVGYPEGNEQ